MNDLSFINLSTYTSPEIKEVKNKDWVSYGADNDYFQFIIDRYNGSPTNHAIINAISAQIYGKGLDATDSSQKPEQYAEMIGLFSKDCVRKLAYDLKLMGQCAIQVIYSQDRTRIAEVEHMPVQTLRAEKCNEEGEIEAYYYFRDWSEYKQQDELLRIPAFGTSQEEIEILYVKPYKAGYFYYSVPDYVGGIQYAELEEEISNFHLNNIMQGMSPSMLINFNNGVPNSEERELIERRIYQKFSGSSNAGKFILAFNDSSESAASIEPVQLSDAHQQYQFLSEESSSKIMLAHRVVSPILLGIKDKTGLGNNADEIKTASILMDNTVIKPFQELLIDAFDQILAYNKIALHLYFKTLQPLEFTDLDNVVDKETREEETGVKLADDRPKLTDEIKEKLLEDLLNIEDEDLSDYEIIDERPANEYDDVLGEAINLASVVSSSPAKTSEQDTLLFKVRYVYTAGRSTKGQSRDFCRKMLSANKVYRKEDLDKESSANSELAAKGESTYNIFLYKGGVNCSHYWMRRIYMRKNNERISVNEAKEKIRKLDPSLKKEAEFEVNPSEVAQIASARNNYWRKN
jgi:hypothetical protein